MDDGLEVDNEVSCSDYSSSALCKETAQPQQAGQEAKDAQIRKDLDTMKLIFHEAAQYASSVARTESNEGSQFKDTRVCSMLAACPNQLLSKIYALREVVTGHAGRHSMLIEDMKFCEEICDILTREE
ncbi:TPA_exp: hypothetical protein A8136_1073 [Trichophyton benhamiae CBS 112371]|nr:TPA_exp: hypothetical protein A8136_1073 [Trichophyton benhamiae CBS 112371]